ncbi:MAG: hypothetical protein PHC46_01730 [Clostridia bacterium]|nr:hypothetical protein [Clostridia bacterium]
MCENCNSDCPVCGCPIVNDEVKGEGCINGACPTNKEEEQEESCN